MTLALRIAAAASAFAAGLLVAGPTAAATQVQLLDRQVTLAHLAWGGTGIARVDVPCTGSEDLCSFSGSVGSPLASSRLGTPSLSIGGAGGGSDAESVYSTVLTTEWATAMTYSFGASGSDVVLSASGSHASSLSVAAANLLGPVDPTAVAESRNWQVFSFTLDGPAAFTLAGQVDQRYNPLSLRWTPDNLTWYTLPVGLTSESTSWMEANGPFTYSLSGTLNAGRYELSNFQLAQGFGLGALAYGYDYSLTLQDAVAAPVPEPATWAMLAMGVAVLMMSRRQKRARRS